MYVSYLKIGLFTFAKIVLRRPYIRRYTFHMNMFIRILYPFNIHIANTYFAPHVSFGSDRKLQSDVSLLTVYRRIIYTVAKVYLFQSDLALHSHVHQNKRQL